jgi:cytochrome c oxidase cbb3-type subunit 3
MLLGAMIFSLVYLMLYPGLGSFEGLLNWSQGKRLVSSYENYEQSFDARRAEIANLALAEVQADPVLMATADRIFRRECSACHGIDGRGQASLFPNLMDIDWQWGGSPEQIEQTLRNGRRANMPAWGPILGEEKTRDVAEYLLDFSDREHVGRPVYEQSCAACHGAEGAGNVFLGAPNLADNIWLYGGDLDSILTTLQEGRLGNMPAFDEHRLDAAQLKLIVAKLAR